MVGILFRPTIVEVKSLAKTTIAIAMAESAFGEIKSPKQTVTIQTATVTAGQQTSRTNLKMQKYIKH